MDAEQVRAEWNASAEMYAETMSTAGGDHNKENVLNPFLFELLGDLAGRRVLDAGCGEGYLSRLLAARGAEVVAVDYSDRLLDIARSRTPDGVAITYRHGNLQSLGALDDGAFDLVVSSMALQDLPDHEAALGELRRVLKDDGALVLGILHPCFSSDGRWQRSDSGEKLFWRVDNYFSETPRPQVMPDGTEWPTYFHRTLTTYIRAFRATGYLIDDLVEPYPSDDVIAHIPGFVNDRRMAHFVVFRLLKEGGATSSEDRRAR